ncbi:MAG TPA: methyltransferase domain-containing protein [Actinomycetota bacterium]|nr:methyltransferase domain-containing protein [Actinomycetota bacterium]
MQLRPHLWRELSRELRSSDVLEIGPGLRPTAPVGGSFFVETSLPAVEVLSARGGHAVRVGGGGLPFRDRSFEAVLALEVLEHVEADEGLMAEIVRVLRPGGTAVVSVPVYMSRWSASDDACAHVRRYEPDELFAKLRRAGLVAERYHVRPARTVPALASIGSGVLHRFPRPSNWWLQNVVFRVQSHWQRRVGRMRWRDVGRPVPPGAGGITVVSRTPATPAG